MQFDLTKQNLFSFTQLITCFYVFAALMFIKMLGNSSSLSLSVLSMQCCQQQNKEKQEEEFLKPRKMKTNVRLISIDTVDHFENFH